MAIRPFSIDMYLSPFAALAISLKRMSRMLVTHSSYVIGVCVGQLLYGILIDRFGRKKPLIIGLLIYLVACIGLCTLSFS